MKFGSIIYRLDNRDVSLDGKTVNNRFRLQLHLQIIELLINVCVNIKLNVFDSLDLLGCAYQLEVMRDGCEGQNAILSLFPHF
jgi:hypothetical protein